MTNSPAPALVPGPALTGSAWDFNGGQGYVQVAANGFTGRLGDTNQTTGITVGMWVNLLYTINSNLDNSTALNLGGGGTVCSVATGNGNGQLEFAFDNNLLFILLRLGPERQLASHGRHSRLPEEFQ